LFTRSNHRPAHAVVNASLATGTASPTTSAWQHVATRRLVMVWRLAGALQCKGMWLPAARSPRS
jgi:hypothetical protein